MLEPEAGQETENTHRQKNQRVGGEETEDKYRLILVWKPGVTAICSHTLPQDSTGAMVQVTGR